MPQRVVITAADSVFACHATEQLLEAKVSVTAIADPTAALKQASRLLTLSGAEQGLDLLTADLTADFPLTRYLANADSAVCVIQESASLSNMKCTEIETRRALAMLRAASASERLFRVVLLLGQSDCLGSGMQQVEKAARDYMAQNRPDFDLVVVSQNAFVSASDAAAATIEALEQEQAIDRYAPKAEEIAATA